MLKKNLREQNSNDKEKILSKKFYPMIYNGGKRHREARKWGSVGQEGIFWIGFAVLLLGRELLGPPSPLSWGCKGIRIQPALLTCETPTAGVYGVSCISKRLDSIAKCKDVALSSRVRIIFLMS